MSQRQDDLAFEPEQFSGLARIFPLPNLVLFPHVVQPLHIFEPRYVELLEDALAGDRLIAMALLQPGWETDYDGRPPIAPIACLGRVLSWQSQPDRRYNLLLLGLRRVRVVRELGPQRAYRQAEVELIDDEYSPAAGEQRKILRRRLVSAFERMLPRIQDCQDLFNQLSIGNLSLGALTDVISYAMDLDVQTKQLLLQERDVDRRAASLLGRLKSAVNDPDEACLAGFPPAFSKN
jgi:uncharacterized protein